MTEPEVRCINVLLVEDDPGDVLMTREAFEDYLHNRLDVVTDGAEALAYLRKEPPYADVPRPDLILLDLNMPRKDGREVLDEVKSDGALKRIPVVMLTTSRDERDILGVYDRHVNCYIVKPVDFEQFSKVVHSIEHFWFTVVKLPAA